MLNIFRPPRPKTTWHQIHACLRQNIASRTQWLLDGQTATPETTVDSDGTITHHGPDRATTMSIEPSYKGGLLVWDIYLNDPDPVATLDTSLPGQIIINTAASILADAVLAGQAGYDFARVYAEGGLTSWAAARAIEELGIETYRTDRKAARHARAGETVVIARRRHARVATVTPSGAVMYAPATGQQARALYDALEAGRRG